MATKPVLAFLSKPRPLQLDENASVVKKKTGTSYTDKTELITYIDSLYVHPDSDSYLYVECECGNTYDYANSVAVPATNVVCSCGRNIISYSS